MTKNILIAVVATAIVVGGFFIFQMTDNSADNAELPTSNTNPDSSQQNNIPQNSDPLVENTGQTTSLAELATGKPQKCNLTINIDSQQATNYHGIIYADGEGRHKIELWKAADPGSVYFTLVTNPWAYTWTNYSNQGIKFDSRVTDPNTNLSSQIDPNSTTQPYEYSCSPWVIDESILTPPTNVTFGDMPEFTN